ncbi:helix-turn-helix domain-containing protein [Pseudomonas rhizosphaerae]|uniref:helix-turn-helix domain-containing protein n=1 Tax=Pseudomonas rhizosphaerae TaxID=216142 RepID=UPI001781072A|nr:helix-turn-helix domain-containing protein [Pseudomonas rhizosphaerae]MBD8614152.1 helix-turn-helix domain-containing protein [Pseudomonas putida]MEB2869979.1 helix-turn-helix domain-containing protein [Pseudomonas rhizosphaerae]
MRTSEATEVLDRLKQLLAAPNDAALAKALGISPQTLGSWRARASIPYGLCMNLARTDGISLDWLLLGRGAMLPEPHALLADESVVAILATLQGLDAQDQEHVHRVALDRKLLRELQQEVVRLRTPN